MKRPLTLVVTAFLLVTHSFAGHLPGGNITYECLGNDSYEVTLQLFRECAGSPMLDQDLSFASDCGLSYTLTLPVGNGTEVSQLCPNDLPQSSCNGGTLPGIELYEISTTVTMLPCDSWTISWAECCRYQALNIQGTPGLYIEATLDNTVSACNNSPQFSESAAPYVCVNQPVSYNLGITEGDGDMLHYSFIDARFGSPVPMPVAYTGSNTGAMPYAGMTLDEQTGLISFVPDMAGYIVIAVQVDEINANGDTIGSVMRDIPFVVLVCANNSPDPTTGLIANLSGMATLTDTTSVSLCPGTSFCFDVTINDADANQSLILTSNVDAVLNGSTFTSMGTNPATGTVCWSAPSGSAGFYTFTITAEDDACPQTAVQSYTYAVTVLPSSDSTCVSTAIGSIAMEQGLSIYPDPAKDQLHLALPTVNTTSAMHLELVDMTGRIEHSQTVSVAGNGSWIAIPDDVSNGTYLVRLSDQQRSFSSRVTIMR